MLFLHFYEYAVLLYGLGYPAPTNVEAGVRLAMKKIDLRIIIDIVGLTRCIDIFKTNIWLGRGLTIRIKFT